MNASTPGGERVRDELVEAAARVFRGRHFWVVEADLIYVALAAVLPLLTAADVPHIERDLRARLAAVIGECDLADHAGRVTSFSRRVRRAAEGPGQ